MRQPSISSIQVHRLGRLALFLLASALVPSTASAQTCFDDAFGALGCSANDVTVSTIALQGGASTTCIKGQTVTLDFEATFQSGASERYDVGLFLALDGGTAATGQCLRTSLMPVGIPVDPNSGIGPYADLEGVDSDLCGDISSGIPTLLNLDNVAIACVDADLDGFLDVSTVTLWASNTASACNANDQTLPSPSAKCRRETVSVPSVVVQSIPPTVATPAAATPSPATGTTTTLSVLGDDDAGETTLIYTWVQTSGPAPATFSDNGTNTAKSSTATFTAPGTYTFEVTITDEGGETVTSSVTVTVGQTATSITISPSSANLAPNATQDFDATVLDQFGDPMASQPSVSWSVTGAPANGTIDATGAYTAPSTGGGPFIVTADAGGGVTNTASVTVVNAGPSVSVAALASPNPVPGTTTGLTALGTDDGGEGNLIYTWATLSGPAPVSFSTNGTNVSKNTTATFTQAGVYDLQVTMTDQGGETATSTVTVTVDQTATSLSVSPASADVAPNDSQDFDATVVDQFGDPLATQPPVGWTVSGGGTIDGAGLFTAGTTAGGPFTVTADAGGGVSNTASVTVVSTAPTVAASAAASPNPASGTTTALSVLGADDGGEANLTYTWVVTSGPAPVAFGDNGTNAAKNTTATFSQAGSYTFEVTIEDQDGATTTSTVMVTVEQAATSVDVTPQTADVAPHGSQDFDATVNDQFGDPLAVQPPLTWGVGAGGSIDGSGLFTAGSNAGGPLTVTADAGGGVSGAADVTIVNAPPTIATAASATPSPATGTTSVLSVLGADDGGESFLVYDWTMLGGPAPVTFTANGTNAAKSSTATFSQAGTYVFEVTVTDEDGLVAADTVQVTVTETPTTLDVSPTTADAAPNGSADFDATVKDQFGNPLTTQPVVSWSVGGGGAIDAAGVFTAGPNAGGPFTVTADAGGGVTNTGAVTIVNEAPLMLVNPIASPNPVPGTQTDLSALAGDDGGEANLTYTWAVTSGPSGVLFSDNGTNDAKSTTADFAEAGSYTLEVTVTDQDGETATGSATVIIEQTATSVAIQPPSVILDPNASQTFVATLLDQFDDPMAVQPTFAWSTDGGGTIDQGGAYTAGGAGGGPFTVTAYDVLTALFGNGTVTIDNDPPTVATAASASPNPTGGTTTDLSVLGADDGMESFLAYTWAQTAGPAPASFSANGTNAAKNATATFPQAGSYTFEVTITDQDGATTTSSVTVTVDQTPTAVTVDPLTAELNINDTQAFNGTTFDQFGNPMTTQPTLTWSVDGGGAVDPSGLFTAGTTAGGPFTVTAAVPASSASGTASVTIIDDPPTVDETAVAAPNPVLGTATTLAVLGTDDGTEPTLTYTWATTSGPGPVVFSDNGTNIAKLSVATFEAAGTYTFEVTIEDTAGQTETSSVTVEVLQTGSTLTIDPTDATTNLNGSAIFSGTVLDQFGDPLATQPALDWSVDGGGTIDVTGTFTADETAGGPHTVTASDPGSGATGTAVVTIVDDPPTVAAPASADEPVDNQLNLSVLGADDGGEEDLRYTWSVSGPALVTLGGNASNAAKDTTALFTEAGIYVFTVTITDASGQSTMSSVTVVIARITADVEIGDDGLYVRRGKFKINWRRHTKERPSDKLKLTGFVNPAGLRGDMSTTVLTVEVNGQELISRQLDRRGRYRTPKGEGPRIRMRVSPKNGRYKLNVRRADLRDLIPVTADGGSGITDVPVTISLSTANTPVCSNTCQFAFATREGVRTKARFISLREVLVDGCIAAHRTKAKLSKRKGGYLIRSKGFLNNVNGVPLVPTGDVQIRVGTMDFTLPLDAMAIRGEGRRARLKFRDKAGPISLFTLKNRRQRYALRAGPFTETELGLIPNADGLTAPMDLAIELPTSIGRVRFNSTGELVRKSPDATVWKRPGRVPEN